MWTATTIDKHRMLGADRWFNFTPLSIISCNQLNDGKCLLLLHCVHGGEGQLCLSYCCTGCKLEYAPTSKETDLELTVMETPPSPWWLATRVLHPFRAEEYAMCFTYCSQKKLLYGWVSPEKQDLGELLCHWSSNICKLVQAVAVYDLVS